MFNSVRFVTDTFALGKQVYEEINAIIPFITDVSKYKHIENISLLALGDYRPSKLQFTYTF